MGLLIDRGLTSLDHKIRAPPVETGIGGDVIARRHDKATRGDELGRFEYATAGQMPPLWVSRDGHAEYLPSNGIPLCVESQLITSDQKTEMPPGSTIVLFSDGLVEHPHRDIVKSLEQLRQIAAEECPKFKPHPARDIYKRMWPRGTTRVDDVAILTFTMKNKVDVTPKTNRAKLLPQEG
jgi:hypothetical protein